MDITQESIERFLNGENDHKYIVGIESEYGENEVSLIIDDPEKGKRIEKHGYVPFTFMKDLKKSSKPFYGGNRDAAKAAMKKNGISIKELRTDGVARLDDGYKYLVQTNKKSYNINSFFKEGGLVTYAKDEEASDRGFLVNNKPTEQFLMQTGMRFFKGFEKYSDIHKFYFDIETTSLAPNEGYIFLIGMCDNRGFRKVLEIDRNNPEESERNMIIEFFEIIHTLSPTIIAGYNSEAFDFPYILGRAEILGVDFGTYVDGEMYYDVRTSLDPQKPIKKRKATVKFGGDTENYEQTLMWGYSVIDIAHAVRSAKAINSEIKAWGLKYITKFIKANKPTRTYVDGDKIFKTWDENKWYYYNTKNFNYQLVHEKYQSELGAEEYKTKLSYWIDEVSRVGDEDSHPTKVRLHEFFKGDGDNIGIIKGKDIVFNYLIDDLEETVAVDEKFGQANFMIGKIMPTDYVRTTTMGNSSKWKLLMTTFSYKEKLAIPATDMKRDIVGGLSRLLNCGYARNVLKMDYSSLYPSIQLTHKVFPDLDITGVMEVMLSYFKDSRTEYKALSGKYFDEFKITKDEATLALATLFDTKQLPVKILNNSQFGAISAPYIFNWGDNNIGERITCTGRQYLRLMVWFFNNHGFKPLVGDTDGFNFAMPENHESLEYVDKKGKKHTSFHATLAEFNDTYMYGAMKLSLDGLYSATINLARKNYIDLNTDGSIKLVGNSLKSTTLCKFYDDAIKDAAKYLVHNDGKSFVEMYYKKLEQIFTGEVPLMEIASKAKVKEKLADYLYDQQHKKDKNGKKVAKKAYMELLVKANIQPSLGSYVYYVNNGTAVSHSDADYAYLLDEMDFISNPEKTGDYNIKQAVSAFNKRMKIFLVCFKDTVRENLLVKDPKKRAEFTDEELELISGKPLEIKKQDVMTIEEHNNEMENEPFMDMSEKEIMFWNRVDVCPKEIFPHFTTETSREPLLSLADKVIKNEQKTKILKFFKDNNLDVKDELDYLKEGEMFIRYSKLFIGEVEKTTKTGKKSKVIEPTPMDEMQWLLSRVHKGIRVDMETLSTDIYS